MRIFWRTRHFFRSNCFSLFFTVDIISIELSCIIKINVSKHKNGFNSFTTRRFATESFIGTLDFYHLQIYHPTPETVLAPLCSKHSFGTRTYDTVLAPILLTQFWHPHPRQKGMVQNLSIFESHFGGHKRLLFLPFTIYTE